MLRAPRILLNVAGAFRLMPGLSKLTVLNALTLIWGNDGGPWMRNREPKSPRLMPGMFTREPK